MKSSKTEKTNLVKQLLEDKILYYNLNDNNSVAEKVLRRNWGNLEFIDFNKHRYIHISYMRDNNTITDINLTVLFYPTYSVAVADTITIDIIMELRTRTINFILNG
jgi:hypothetical protein